MDIAISYAVTPEWPKMEWVATAFERIGHTVRRIHKDPVQLAKAMRECDFVILGHKSLGGRWPNIKDAFAARNCPVVYWWFDLIATHPRETLQNQPLFRTWARPTAMHLLECDIVLVKERSLLDDYRRLGVNAYWFDQGVLSDFPEVKRQEPEWDVLLWGSAATWDQRISEVKSAISSGFSVAWATRSENIPSGVVRLPWTDPDKLPEIAGKARCVLSCGFRNDIEGYWSDSFWMAVGMGNCVLRRYTPGMPEGPYHVYHTESELCDLIRWVKKDPDQVIQTGKRAREWATTKHSLEQRARDLIQLVRTVTEQGKLKLPKMAL